MFTLLHDVCKEMLKVVQLRHFTLAGLTLSTLLAKSLTLLLLIECTRLFDGNAIWHLRVVRKYNKETGGLIKADLVYGQPPPNLTKGRLRKSLSHHVALV